MRNLVLIAIALLAIACDDSPTAPSSMPSPAAATFSQVQNQIFNASCVMHHGDPASAGLDLRSPQSYNNLVNVISAASGIALVVPGNADGSYLVHKLEGRAGIAGGRMPLFQTPLSDDQIQLVRDWIQAGAQNN